MIANRSQIAVLALALFAANLQAQAPVTAPPLARYPEIRTRFNQSLSTAVSNEQRLEVFRQTVSQGRHSGRPLMANMFGNFQSGLFTLPSTTPGLGTTVRLLASDNRNVVIGNVRALRYADSLHGDGRFQVTGLNRPRVNSLGKTDADIAFRHQSTGLRVRMEVKIMALASQRSNLVKIEKQILKMAQDALLTGETQVWANRQTVLPYVRVFAERHGVIVEERLRTGSSNLRPEDRTFKDFANRLDKELRVRSRMTAVGGSLNAGMGLFLAYQGIRQLRNDMTTFGGTQSEWLRLGEHGSDLFAGVGFSTAGGVQLARQIPSLANSGRLIAATKWGERAGIAGTVIAESVLVAQYWNGDLTGREFWHRQASLGGGLAGGAAGGFVGFKAGALAGGAAGSVFGPGGTVIAAGIGGTFGAVGGSFGGGYLGAHFAVRGIESLYHLQDVEHQECYVRFLLGVYQTR